MGEKDVADCDAIIIGSGFGGSMVAQTLIDAGRRVVMLERGDWVVRGPHNWRPEGTVDLTSCYTKETPYRVLAGGNSKIVGSYSCVGGPSVFYGGVSMRLRERDFVPDREIVGDSEARWPIAYAELEPYYERAEKILGVAGEAGVDPTEPFRRVPFPQAPAELAETSRRIEAAARAEGLHPFRLPLAINYATDTEQASCVACTTCDTFACAVGAKNDLATRVLPPLIARGLQLRRNTVAVKLLTDGGRISAVRCYDKALGHTVTYTGRVFVLSAGALASPHLLLASNLQHRNPGGHTVGRFLMRHCNGIAFGFFISSPSKENRFHKQLGIHDYYFGHPTVRSPAGKLGSMQQLQTPPVGLVKALLPSALGHVVSRAVPHLTGLLVMAEDQPRQENRVTVDSARRDRLGLPQLLINHRHTERDLSAREALLQKARGVLRRAGALFCYNHKIKTFSHAVGTVRMGTEPETSALDQRCRFRGVDNLFVVDGSFMPTSGGLNPSLTISANALRIGEHITATLENGESGDGVV